MDLGNKFWDQIAGIHVELAPNGTIDGPPTLSVTPDSLTIENISESGLAFDVLFPEEDIPAYAITAQAPADNPSTPDLESVSITITGSLSHSKATSLGANVTDIPR